MSLQLIKPNAETSQEGIVQWAVYSDIDLDCNVVIVEDSTEQLTRSIRRFEMDSY